MERIYNTYLKIIKNICTGSDHSVSVHPEDLPALAKLAQEHCTVPSDIYLDNTELNGDAVSREKINIYRTVQENSSLVA